ncbi:MAG: ATP-binding cassette domain-containing protein [Ignisphaera sp.]|nr:ATP-binding cassette domain-containing protein [Ignisphaera sp.]MCX8167489.1 ATP-binding cassette domain-containing protein [Ignisphaera sp.]MDW8084647.1 ATP-binding cassette domain-containing protein [Ignisphaera sp.]
MSDSIRAVKISKRFGDVIALDDVSLTIDSGEIVAVLGENGSGKSTLAKIFYGIYTPDKGYIEISGKREVFSSPADAKRCGIVMVSQRPQLIDELTLLENVAVFLNKPVDKIYGDVNLLLKEFNVGIDAASPVYMLSYTEKQYVEMIKALLARPRLLIVDEATTYLPQPLKIKFFDLMKKIVMVNGSIIFITHKIPEALEFSSRIIVLRKGRVVGEFDGGVPLDELRKAMFGDTAAIQIARHIKKLSESELESTVLSINNVSVLDEYGKRAVEGVSLGIKQGEIVGVVGVAGNGQRELCEAIVGLRRIEKGQILFKGKDITYVSPNKRIAMGLCYIPEDPFRDGVFLNLTIAENLKIFSQRKIEKKALHNIINKLNITPAKPEIKLHKLSGGNVQKVALSRIFANIPRLIVAYNPTRMLDEYSSKLIISTLTRFASSGGSALLFLEDLDEALTMGDRIAVMVKGRIVGMYSSTAVDKSELEKVMTIYG